MLKKGDVAPEFTLFATPDQKISLQLWTADDTDHRLTVEKTKKIVALSQSIISSNDAEIEVEYQQDTIGKFGLQYSNKSFQLTATQTACLAWDACSVPKEKEKLNLANLVSNESSCCTPGGGCC